MAYVSQCLSQSNFTECTTSLLHLTQVRNHPMTSPGSKCLCGSVSFRGRARLSSFLRETATQTDVPGSDSTRLHMSLDITHTHTHAYTHWLPGGLGGVPTSCWEPTYRHIHTVLTVSRSLCFLWKRLYPCDLTKITFAILVDRPLKLIRHGLGWKGG